MLLGRGMKYSCQQSINRVKKVWPTPPRCVDHRAHDRSTLLLDVGVHVFRIGNILRVNLERQLHRNCTGLSDAVTYHHSSNVVFLRNDGYALLGVLLNLKPPKHRHFLDERHMKPHLQKIVEALFDPLDAAVAPSSMWIPMMSFSSLTFESLSFHTKRHLYWSAGTAPICFIHPENVSWTCLGACFKPYNTFWSLCTFPLGRWNPGNCLT